MLVLTVSLIIILIFLSGFYFVKRRYSYWERNNVPFIRPSFPYGNVNGPNPKVHTTQLFTKYYQQTKLNSPYCGLFILFQPILLAVDLDLIKSVLVKDFQFFVNRGTYHNEKDDPLTGTLINIENQKWRDLRAQLTPTFTSGKMKFMFPTIIETANEFKTCLENEIKISSEIEIREMIARFTTDVIGSCAFGIECNSLKNPNATFRKMGREIFVNAGINRIKRLFALSFPNVARTLHITVTKPEVSDFFMGTVRETIEFREKNNVKRSDFMELLINLKNESLITTEQIAAQAFLFFLAGFETSSTVISFALYELAINQKIQEKVRDEIENVLKMFDGQLTYEAMLDLKYLDQVVNETLRKYPPVLSLIRKSTKDYFETKLNILFEQGTSVFIPVYAIHHDPEYYPDPEKFDPDRFTDDEIRKRNRFAFLPFGEGPRSCIGLRFGIMQTKVGLVKLLQNFKFTKSSKLRVPLKFKHNAVVLTPDGGLVLKIEKII